MTIKAARTRLAIMKKMRVNIMVRVSLRLMESQLRLSIFLNIVSFLVTPLLWHRKLKRA